MDDQQRARELLAAQLPEGDELISDILADNFDLQFLDKETVIAAITAALRAAPEGLIEQHARDSQELRRLCQSRDFYKRRCEALQAVQSSMRDPERKAVCDILANSETAVCAAARPQGVE